MSVVRAAGLIVYRRMLETFQYLMMQTSYGEHHWTPPKGHVDPGETDMEAALRETQEEAGLTSSDLNIASDFKKELNYEVKGKPKIVTYWLAELKDPSTPVKLSNEHQDFKWLNLQQACDHIPQFINQQEMLKETEEYLQTHK